MADQVAREGRADDFRFELRRPDGDTFWASASARRVTSAARPPFSRCSRTSPPRSRPNGRSRRAKSGWRRRATRSPTLTAQHAVPQGSFEERLRDHPRRSSAATLKAGRLSLWRLAEDGDSIRCDGLYCLDPPRFTLRRRADPRRRARLLRGARAGAGHRGAPTPAPTRGPATSRRAISRRAASAPCSTCRSALGRPRLRGPVCRTRRRPAHVDGGRAELRGLHRQPRRDGARRGGPARRRWRAWPTARPGRGSSSTPRTTPSSASTPHGRIVTWNAQAEATLGWTRDEALGRDMATTGRPAALPRGPPARHGALPAAPVRRRS